MPGLVPGKVRSLTGGRAGHQFGDLTAAGKGTRKVHINLNQLIDGRTDVS
jgi:hypothetical protein